MRNVAVTAVALLVAWFPTRGPTPAQHDGGSSGWSGFGLSTSAPFWASVDAVMILPKIDCVDAPNGSIAVWDGMDGVNNPAVEQSGFTVGCSQGVPSADWWYEDYPRPAVSLMNVTADIGKKVGIGEEFLGGSSFTSIFVTNGVYTTHESVAPSARRESVEWTTESARGVDVPGPLTVHWITTEANGTNAYNAHVGRRWVFPSGGSLNVLTNTTGFDTSVTCVDTC